MLHLFDWTRLDCWADSQADADYADDYDYNIHPPDLAAEKLGANVATPVLFVANCVLCDKNVT